MDKCVLQHGYACLPLDVRDDSSQAAMGKARAREGAQAWMATFRLGHSWTLG